MVLSNYIDRASVLGSTKREAQEGVIPCLYEGSWHIGWNVASVRMVVCYQRFVTSPSFVHFHTSVVFPFDKNGRTLTVFASADEEYAGRCSTVQINDTRKHVCITLIDTRLTASRLASVANSMHQWCGQKEATDSDGVIASARGALANVVVTWPGTPAPLVPNLAHMLARGSTPQPVEVIRRDVVSIAGGSLIIASLDPDTAMRCIQDRDDLAYETMGERGTLARICSKIVDTKSAVLLVCQDGPGASPACSYQCDVSVPKNIREMTLVTGIPAAQVAVLPHSCLRDCIGANSDGFYLNDVPTATEIMEEHQSVLKRDEATQTIRRLIVSENVLSNIKKRVWRPGGNLVAKMMSNG